MPVRTLAALTDKALAAGLDPATPAVAVARATRADEAIIAATIADLPAQLVAEAPRGPVLVMIGRVFAACVESAAMPSCDSRHGVAVASN